MNPKITLRRKGDQLALVVEKRDFPFPVILAIFESFEGFVSFVEQVQHILSIEIANKVADESELPVIEDSLIEAEYIIELAKRNLSA